MPVLINNEVAALEVSVHDGRAVGVQVEHPACRLSTYEKMVECENKMRDSVSHGHSSEKKEKRRHRAGYDSYARNTGYRIPTVSIGVKRYKKRKNVVQQGTCVTNS